MTEQVNDQKVDQVIGAVLYADGSSKPNPGFSGCGIHGYIYTTLESKKGSGQPDHVMTDKGYIRKPTYAEMHPKDAPIKVTPLAYIDGYSSYSVMSTNNAAELAAVLKTLKHLFVNQPDVTQILVLTDSMYTINSCNDWIAKYKARGWVKKDGSSISNISELKELDEILCALAERNVSLVIDYIEGHAGFIGNHIADMLANVGSNGSRIGRLGTLIDTVDADGYWKPDNERHPFLSARKVYFNTLKDSHTPGIYFMGDHGKEDDQAGKKIPDSGFSYVEIAEPEKTIEIVRNVQSRVAGEQDSIVYARMDYLFNPLVNKFIKSYGDLALAQTSSLRHDLYGVDDEPATREFKPPRIASRSIDALNAIADTLKWFCDGSPNFVGTEITDILYEKNDDPKKGLTYKLRPEFIVGYAALPVQVSYDRNNKDSKEKIILSLGIDMPDRNALKRLEAYKPIVNVVTWMESDKAFRYAVVITTANDKGIWCGCYSNLRLLTK